MSADTFYCHYCRKPRNISFKDKKSKIPKCITCIDKAKQYSKNKKVIHGVKPNPKNINEIDTSILYMTANEVAKAANVSYSTISRALRLSIIHSIVIKGKYYIHPNDCEKYIKQCKEQQ